MVQRAPTTDSDKYMKLQIQFKDDVKKWWQVWKKSRVMEVLASGTGLGDGMLRIFGVDGVILMIFPLDRIHSVIRLELIDPEKQIVT